LGRPVYCGSDIANVFSREKTHQAKTTYFVRNTPTAKSTPKVRQCQVYANCACECQVQVPTSPHAPNHGLPNRERQEQPNMGRRSSSTCTAKGKRLLSTSTPGTLSPDACGGDGVKEAAWNIECCSEIWKRLYRLLTVDWPMEVALLITGTGDWERRRSLTISSWDFARVVGRRGKCGHQCVDRGLGVIDGTHMLKWRVELNRIRSRLRFFVARFMSRFPLLPTALEATSQEIECSATKANE
jgi:hypothetical protein